MKSGSVIIGNTEMYYVAFGSGPKKVVVLPGLSDGLATVKGKALILSQPYRKYFGDFTVYMFSRKNDNPDKNVSVGISGTFKPRIFDRIKFIEKYILPLVSE